MLKVSKYTTGVIQTNVYFCFDDTSRECVIIDPAANAAKIIEIVEQQLHALPQAILLTHGHFDHMMAAEETAKHFGVEIFASEKERELLKTPEWNLSSNFQLDIEVTKFTALKDHDVLPLLGHRWEVIATPGHTSGSVSYYVPLTMEEEAANAGLPEKERQVPLLFSGDTLFRESYGRTDFPGGSETEILDSICNRLLVLPPETLVFPGHEGMSSIANEQKYNPAAYLTMMKQKNNGQ
jgi:hydroxyacylglutathione hydrolase